MQQPSRRIEELHVTFQPTARLFLTLAQQSGLNLAVIQTYRPTEYQKWLWESGRSRPGAIVTQAAPGQSAHEFRLAFDVAPVHVLQFPDWLPADPAWQEIGAIARELELEWGGDFKSIKDQPHIQHKDWKDLK
jgi:peptidoglycan L-alanyl-D-glutamate endopeptidase CwlK